jgi:hypothetical protein
MNVRELPPINPATGKPWKCLAPEHNCSGPVIGAIGAIPCCRHGIAAERDKREADQARIDALLADPEFKAQIEREAAQERAWESRWS